MLAAEPVTPVQTTPLPIRPELSIPSVTPQATTPATPRIGAFALAGGSASVPIGSALGSPLPWSYTTPSPMPMGTLGNPGTAPKQSSAKQPPPQARKGSRAQAIAGGGPASSSTESPPPLRRSVRLFSSAKAKPASKEPKRKAGKRDDFRIAPLPEPHPASAQTPNNPSTPAPADMSLNTTGGGFAVSRPEAMTPFGADAVVSNSAAAAALQLLNTLGKAVVAISNYNCTAAVDILSALPQHQFYTGWAQCHIGKVCDPPRASFVCAFRVLAHRGSNGRLASRQKLVVCMRYRNHPRMRPCSLPVEGHG